jgi:hypothetical protein
MQRNTPMGRIIDIANSNEMTGMYLFKNLLSKKFEKLFLLSYSLLLSGDPAYC